MSKKNILTFLIIAIILTFIILGFFILKRTTPNNQPMTLIYHNPCDIDFDEDCDTYDYEFIKKAIGQCEGGFSYNEPADADHDGCVTETDLQILFPRPPQ